MKDCYKGDSRFKLFTNFRFKEYSDIQFIKGKKWGYYKSRMQWVMIDDMGNIIKELVDDNGTKLWYFRNHGYLHESYKKCLAVTLHDANFITSKDCPNCINCIKEK